MSFFEKWLESLRREIVTPDMVSLWLPSGQNRAQDIIRDNHGQCFGAHPNVPVLPNLINPSFGWKFDGTDDYVSVPSSDSLNITDVISFSFWYQARALFSTTSNTYGVMLLGDDVGWKVYGQKSDDKLKLVLYGTIATKALISDGVVVLNQWYHVIVTYDGTTGKMYVNGTLQSGTATGAGNLSPNLTTTYIGGGAMGTLDGYIALPFVAHSAWSAAQMNNFYLQTRDFFQPRG